MIIAHKCKVPTRSQISVVHRIPHYSPRLVFSLGIVQSVSGIALIFLSLVLLRLDRERTFAWSISIHYLDNVIPDILRIVWLGLWVLITGLITLMVSCRPYSNCQVYVLLISSLMTIAITGTFAILISNHVIQQSVLVAMLNKDNGSSLTSSSISPPSPPTQQSTSSLSSFNYDDVQIRYAQLNNNIDSQMDTKSNPILFFNIFMLCFCMVSFVVSIISFSIVSHHLCSCSLFNDKFSTDYHIYDTTVWSRKERIVQWVMQQSAINTSTATATTTTSTNTAVNDQTTLSLHRPELILTDTGSYLDLLHGTNLSLYGT